MAVPIVKFVQAVRKARQVIEHYKQYVLGGDDPALSIQDLVWTIQDMYSLNIELVELDFVGEFVRGLMERYSNNRCRIIVRRNQPEDMKRFVTVKELSHIVMDENEDWSPDGENTLREILSHKLDFSPGGGSRLDELSPPALSEYLAHFVAIDLLYPSEYRDSDAIAVADGSKIISALASSWGVPPFVIELALDEVYRGLLRDITPLI